MFKRSLTKIVVVSNPAGLHARPCLAIVNAVKGCDCRVEIRKDRQVVNANEILQLMSLGAANGTELVLTASGPDAPMVLAKLVDLFANHFGLE